MPERQVLHQSVGHLKPSWVRARPLGDGFKHCLMQRERRLSVLFVEPDGHDHLARPVRVHLSRGRFYKVALSVRKMNRKNDPPWPHDLTVSDAADALSVNRIVKATEKGPARAKIELVKFNRAALRRIPELQDFRLRPCFEHKFKAAH